MKACERHPAKSAKRKTLPAGRRKKGFRTVESGFDKETAMREARRCLGQRVCESCETCSLFCPDLCITRDASTGDVLFDLDFCKGCGICAAVCPRGAIQMAMEENV